MSDSLEAVSPHLRLLLNVALPQPKRLKVVLFTGGSGSLGLLARAHKFGPIDAALLVGHGLQVVVGMIQIGALSLALLASAAVYSIVALSIESLLHHLL